MYEAYSLEFEAGPYRGLTSALTIEPPSLFFKLKLHSWLERQHYQKYEETTFLKDILLLVKKNV